MWRRIFFLLGVVISVSGICSGVLVPEFMDEKMKKERQLGNKQNEEENPVACHFEEISSLEEISPELRKRLILSKDEKRRQKRN